MQANLFIPKKIHVGFQSRRDTYTGKLAYLVCEDEKGKIRKEYSWNSWKNDSIQTLTLDNTPGRFVLNKGIQRNGYFGSGRSVIRVYDSRDFEFEISVDNLIGILMHSDVSKRDIEEECVFSWSGKDLVLLPINSEEYRQSLAYTDKQSLKISAKDLVKGYTYEQKKSNTQLVYMGYHPFYSNEYKLTQIYEGKRHVFYKIQNSKFVIPGVATLATCINNQVYTEFAELDDKLHKSLPVYY